MYIHICVHMELCRGSVLIPLPSPWLTQLSTTDAHGKVIVGPEPPTASTITTASREGEGGTPSTSCEDMCTLRIKSEKGDTVHTHTHTHTHTTQHRYTHTYTHRYTHTHFLPCSTRIELPLSLSTHSIAPDVCAKATEH